MAKSKVIICPYCGDTQAAGERCRSCSGLFEPLSRQATHNAMGPWFMRDERRPFQPGCSYETLVKLIERGQITRYAIVRGPTTRQFWTVARRVPGIAHLLGYCHNCDASVDAQDHGCHACGVPFGAYLDRNFMGLPEIRPLPWEASQDEGVRDSDSTSRLVDFRRAAEPLGLSSFASDEELRSEDVPPPPGYAPSFAAAPAVMGESAATSGARVFSNLGSAPAIDRSPSPSPSLADSRRGAAPGAADASPAGLLAAQSLRRKVEAQRHTI